MFVLNCPLCSKSLQLDDRAASLTIVCPHCRKKIQLSVAQSAVGPLPSPALPSLPPLPLPAIASGARPASSGFVKALAWIFIPAALLLGGAGYYWYFHIRPASPLTAHADVLPADAVVVIELDLAELADVPAVAAEASKLARALRVTFKDLDLEPRSAGITAQFLAVTLAEQSLSVWTFDAPVSLGDSVLTGRFAEVNHDGQRLLADRYQPGMHWAIDARGRLLRGPRPIVQAVLARQAQGKDRTATGLELAARAIPGSPPFWLAGDFSGDAQAAAAMLPATLAREIRAARLDSLVCYASDSAEQGLIMKGRATCPTDEDSLLTLAAFEKFKRRAYLLTFGKVQQPEWRLFGKLLPKCSFELEERAIALELPLRAALARQALEQQTASVIAGYKKVVLAIRKDIRELSAQAAKDLAAEKFREAEAAQAQVVALAPGNAAAQEKLKEIGRARDAKDRFLALVAATEKGLAALDADAARTNLAQARALRGHDPAIPVLEKKLAALGKRLDFAKLVAEADTALAKKDLALAAHKFTAAAALGLDTDRIKADLGMIDRIVKAQSCLDSARKHRDGKDIDGILSEADRIKDAIFGDSRAAIESDPRLKEVAEKLGAGMLSVLVDAARAVRLGAADRQAKGRKLYAAKNYAAAEKEYRGVVKELERAKAILARPAALGLKDALGAADAEKAFVDVDLRFLEREADKCKGLAAHLRGNELVREGLKQFALAKKDSAVLPKARDKFKEAVKYLEQSAAIPGILSAGDLKEARGYLLRITRMIEPLDLDFSTKRDLKDWGPLPKGWRFRSRKELTWLQTDLTAAGGLLTSPMLDLPTDFTLRLECCVFDDQCVVRNSAWKSFANMLSITLVTRGDRSLAMALGRDPNAAQLETILTVGKRRHYLSLEDVAGPIPLVLIRRQQDVAIEIAGKTIATAALDGEVQRIIVQVRNGRGPNEMLRYFPGFTRIALSRSAKSEKPEKAEPKESTRRRRPGAIAEIPRSRRSMEQLDRHQLVERAEQLQTKRSRAPRSFLGVGRCGGCFRGRVDAEDSRQQLLVVRWRRLEGADLEHQHQIAALNRLVGLGQAVAEAVERGFVQRALAAGQHAGGKQL